MKKEPNTPSKNRMIHVRLDDRTHKRLKLEAVHRETTVQNLVEQFILSSLTKARPGDVR